MDTYIKTEHTKHTERSVDDMMNGRDVQPHTDNHAYEYPRHRMLLSLIRNGRQLDSRRHIHDFREKTSRRDVLHLNDLLDKLHSPLRLRSALALGHLAKWLKVSVLVSELHAANILEANNERLSSLNLTLHFLLVLHCEVKA